MRFGRIELERRILAMHIPASAPPAPPKSKAEEKAEEAKRIALAINPGRRGVLPDNWKR